MKSKSRSIVRVGLGGGIGMLALMTFSFLGSATAAYAQSSTTTCPTDAYTGQTVPGCTTAPTLTISYNAGTVTWQACGYTQGTNVSLAIDGSNVSGAGSSEAAGSDGCTDPTVSVCLAAGTHSASASASGYSDATQTFTVAASACAGTSGSGTGLASTGADVIGGLALALLTIVGGSTLLSAVNRRRQSVR